jgi:hypothetical protein
VPAEALKPALECVNGHGSLRSDAIPASVTTADSLAAWCGVCGQLSDLIRRIATQRKIVVIFDQLDAISELADRNTQRLNILLNLLHNLSSTENIHIIASCREFDHRHDARLNTIQAAELRLDLPEWETVANILRNAGIDASRIHDTTKQLLRTPLHLKLFLDVGRPEIGYANLQSLNEELWHRNVLINDGILGRVELVNRLASIMIAHEELWVSSVFADEFPDALKVLQRDEILASGTDGRTVGLLSYEYTCVS